MTGIITGICWQKSGIILIKCLYCIGELHNAIKNSWLKFQWFLTEKLWQMWVQWLERNLSHIWTSSLWHLKPLDAPLVGLRFLIQISKDNMSSGSGQIWSLEESPQRFLLLCILGNHLETNRAGIKVYFPSEIGSQMEGGIESLSQRRQKIILNPTRHFCSEMPWWTSQWRCWVVGPRI